jgi:ankyrin repeat protein
MAQEGGLPVSWSNDVGQTALHIAAIWGSLKAIKALVSLGADVNAANDLSAATPLHLAGSDMRVDHVRVQGGQSMLLHGKALGKGGKTKTLAAIEMLVQAGADCAKRDRHGNSPWFYASDEETRIAMKGERPLAFVLCP